MIINFLADRYEQIAKENAIDAASQATQAMRLQLVSMMYPISSLAAFVSSSVGRNYTQVCYDYHIIAGPCRQLQKSQWHSMLHKRSLAVSTVATTVAKVAGYGKAGRLMQCQHQCNVARLPGCLQFCQQCQHQCNVASL